MPWKPAKYGESIKWNDPDLSPAIQALLTNEDGTIKLKEKVEYDGNVYEASEFRGENYVFKKPLKDGAKKQASQPVEVIESAPVQNPEPTIIKSSETSQPISSDGEGVFIEVSKVVKFAMVKPAEVDKKLTEGYELYGSNGREACVDGMVALVKYEVVKAKVA